MRYSDDVVGTSEQNAKAQPREKNALFLIDKGNRTVRRRRTLNHRSQVRCIDKQNNPE